MYRIIARIEHLIQNKIINTIFARHNPSLINLIIDPQIISENDAISSSLCCPKCENDVQFDSIKTYQQHFSSVHSSKQSIEEYHW